MSKVVLWAMAMMALPVLLAGCQTERAVSLDEAKQISASFEGTSFTPPPRTISDITAVLDAQDPDSETIAGRLEIANAQPPEGVSPPELVSFYLKRERAARDLGRAEQQVQDLQKALEHMDSQGALHGAGGAEQRSDALMNLGWAQLYLGRYQNSVRSFQKGSEAFPSAAIIGGQVYTNAWAGNIEEARKLKAKAVNMEQGVWRRIFDVWLEQAILEAEGRWVDMEPVVRSAIDHIVGIRFSDGDEEITWQIEIRNILPRNLVNQGRIVEAEIEARDVLDFALKKVGKFHFRTVDAIRELARAVSAQGRHKEAIILLDEGLHILDKIGMRQDSNAVGSTRHAMAHAFLELRDWKSAWEQVRLTREGMKDSPQQYELWFANDVTVPASMIQVVILDEALELTDRTLKRRQENLGKKHFFTAQTQALYAMSLAKSERRLEAVAAFKKALPILVTRSRVANGTEARSQGWFMKLVFESYLDLLSDIDAAGEAATAGVDPAAEAFVIADRARSRAVQAALAATATRAAARDPDLADLVRREQDLQKQINAHFGTLAKMVSLPPDQQDPKSVETLRERIDTLHGARAALMEVQERRFPEISQLINPKPLTIEETRSFLRRGEALIATYVTDK